MLVQLVVGSTITVDSGRLVRICVVALDNICVVGCRMFIATTVINRDCLFLLLLWLLLLLRFFLLLPLLLLLLLLVLLLLLLPLLLCIALNRCMMCIVAAGALCGWKRLP